MKIFRSIKELNNCGECVCALGNFDGIHKGHQKLIESAVSIAKSKALRSAVFTFTDHPLNVMSGHIITKNILSFDDSFDIPSYMVRPFQWALGSGVYTADSAVLGFGRTITEAEAADMILNMNNPVVSPVLGGGAVSLAGGWTNALSAEIPENAQKAFDKATEGLTGAGYTPIAYLGSQVVAGINYKFVCIKQLIYPGATPQLVTVKVYAALDGTATITDVQEIVLP